MLSLIWSINDKRINTLLPSEMQALVLAKEAPCWTEQLQIVLPSIHAAWFLYFRFLPSIVFSGKERKHSLRVHAQVK
jgi:hypothetical protein